MVLAYSFDGTQTVIYEYMSFYVLMHYFMPLTFSPIAFVILKSNSIDWIAKLNILSQRGQKFQIFFPIAKYSCHQKKCMYFAV